MGRVIANFETTVRVGDKHVRVQAEERCVFFAVILLPRIRISPLFVGNPHYFGLDRRQLPTSDVGIEEGYI